MALTGWAYSILYVIDISAIDSDQSNYVAPLHMSASCGKTGFDFSDFFSKLGSNHKKVAFEFNDTGAECYAECAQWDSSANKALYNVRLPNIYAATTISIRVYYDPAHADNTAYVGDIGSTVGETVYDSGFKVAHQMANDPSGTPPQMIDSTSNSFDGTTYGSMTSDDLINAVYGGKGLDLEGSGDRVVLPSFSTANITIEILVRIDYLPGDGARQRLITKWTGGGTIVDGSWIIDLANTSGVYSFRFLVRVSGSTIIASYNFTPTVGQYYYIVTTGDGTNFKLYKSGAQVASVSGASIQDLTQPITIAGTDPLDTTYTFDGVNALTRISTVDRGADWIKTTYFALVDDLFTLVTDGQIETAIDQLYGAGPVDPTGIDQVWGLLHDTATIGLLQTYTILYGEVAQAIELVYGIELAAILRQPYGNAVRLLAAMKQCYGNAANISTGLEQKWADALRLDTGLEQGWSIFGELVLGLAQRYSLTEGEVINALAHLYDIQSLQAPISTGLLQVSGLLGSFNIHQYTFVVLMGGTVLSSVSRIAITEDINQYLIRAEITLTSQAENALVFEGAPLQIHVSGITYELFVASKGRSRSRELASPNLEYTLVGLSLTAGLDVPRGLPLTRDWPSGGLVSEIVAELAEGYTLDGQIVDWPIKGGTLFANNESRLEVIRKIIRDRGKLQTAPAGTLLVVPEYKVSPPNWPTAAVDHTLSELDDLFTASESWDERDRTNAVFVSDQLEADERFILDQAQLDESRIYYLGYRVPWDAAFTLYHSGGNWVTVQSLGVVSESHTEQVEFVDGRGQVSKPVYSMSAVSWLQAQLGAVTFGEDGALRSEIEGNSLASITYTTKYRKWLATDPRNEDVQFWLDEVAS